MRHSELDKCRARRSAIRRKRLAVRGDDGKFALAVQGASDGLWDWDVPSGHVQFSDRWTTMLGYGRRDIPPTVDGWFALVHLDDIDWLRAAIDGAEGSQAKFELEYRIRNRQGEWRWVLCRGLALRDRQGKLLRVAGSQSDIDQRRRQEEELRLSQQRYVLAASAANEGLWDWDMVKGEVYFSPRWKTMIGLPVDEPMNSIESWFERVHPDDVDWLQAAMEGSEETGGRFEIEYRMQNADGEWRWMLCCGMVLTDVSGTMIRAAGSQTDIQHRKEQERALVAMKNYTESILQSLTNGVVTLDHEHRITRANHAALNLFGLPETRALGERIGDLFPQDPWIGESIDRVSRDRASDTTLDTDLSLPSGGTASVNLTTVQLRDLLDEPLGSMLVIEDMTREKRIKSTMARYLTKGVMDKVLESGTDSLGGTLTKATILFSDIRKFTELAENIGPRATVQVLNDYFTRMVEVIFTHNGVLDKYIGDAIMAVFGAPLETEQDTDNAIDSACNMLRALNRINAERRERGEPPLDIGVALATGPVVSGNIGSPKRMDYTVIGDTVNLASRLETATKFYGARVIIADTTKAAMLRPHRLRELDLVRVRGRVQPLTIYEALDHHSPETFPHLDDMLNQFAQGLEQYRARRWKDGEDIFRSVLDLVPGDRPSQIYLERCQRFNNEPPDHEWNGVWPLAAG